MFGRAEKSVCGQNDTRFCRTSDALSVVGALCETKRTCRIPANKALFGESCGNIPSYVKVLYKCVDDRVSKLFIIQIVCLHTLRLVLLV